MNDKANVLIVGIVCVALILCIALYMGEDGTLLASGIGAICTIIGYFFGIKTEVKETSTIPKKT